jgi:opacity protein-like surface antigen
MKRLLRLTVLGILAASPGAWAGDTAIGVGAGYVDPSDIGGTAWFTANVRFKLGESIALEPEAGYWKKSESVPGLLDASVKDLNTGVNVLYLVPAGDKVEVWLGGGVGVHFLSGSVGVLGFEESESETKFGGQLLAGLDLKVTTSVALFAAVRYDLVSDFNQFKAYGGFRFGL